MLHVACLISEGAGVSSPGIPSAVPVFPCSRLEGWQWIPAFPLWRREEKAMVQDSALLMHQSSNCSWDPFNPEPPAADSDPSQLGHQDCLPLRSLEDPFAQCSWNSVSIQPFSGQTFNSVTESLFHSCSKFSFLDLISNLDSCAGIPASELYPVSSSRGTRTLLCFCFHPHLGFPGFALIATPSNLTPMLPASWPPWILIYVCWMN